MFPLCLLVTFLSVLLNIESTPLSPRGTGSTDCSIGSGQLAGYIGDPIHEASGLAVSRMNPGVLYTHPDSQHTNHVWAMAYGAQVRIPRSSIEYLDFTYPMSKREAGKSLTLEYITTLPMKYVTGADISPTGNTLAITNLAEGYSYTKTAGVSWGDFLKGYGSYFCTLRINYLPQMEAIAVTEDGYWSTTENCDYCPIWYYPRY